MPYRCNSNREYYIPHTNDELLKYITDNNCTDCFLTVYAFGLYDQNERDKTTAIIDTIPLDFDDEEHPENALEDVRKTVKWAKKLGLNIRIHYSGNKGFHVFIDIDPITLQYPHKALRKFVEGMQEAAGFETIDLVVTGDLDRVIRIPNTIHGKTGRYCIMLDPRDVMLLNMPDIEYAAREKSTFISRRIPNGEDVTDWLRYYDKLAAKDEEEKEQKRNVRQNSPFASMLVGKSRRCIAYDDLIKCGTSKGARDYAVCGIIHKSKKLGMSEPEIRKLLLQFANKCKPAITESLIDSKLRYHMNVDYSPCTFLKNVSTKCSECPRG
jgi:hypothetical protein